ncbi:MAG: right-handed parallel beta-helix repeat-containing protein [Planctomycetes bacterium]|nr:right-handed parallel beta-helix repeat-containing protein [Planctomycetota bacterium]
MLRRHVPVLALAVLTVAAPVIAVTARAGDAPRVVTVRNIAELRAAVAAAKPGTRIELAPGTYEGSVYATDLHGTAAAPIVIAGADAKDPPLIRGGGNGLQLVDPAYVELRDLAFAGQTGNGIAIDDGGTFDTPAHHITLLRVSVKDVGSVTVGNAIKLSGVDDFVVSDCTAERWGVGGCGVDMVGCRRGTIDRCTFRHSPDAATQVGVQAKGGSRDVTIRRCRFDEVGDRGVNIGGNTGPPYFRPQLANWVGPKFEAKDIRVEGNTFIGSKSPIVFAGTDGAIVRWNTFYVPSVWVVRILQETREPGFVACRNGAFTDNIVAFRSDRWREGGVNVGPGTEPASFEFARNVWFCTDAPSRTRELVRTPAPESDGVYGKDPKFTAPEKGDFTLRSSSPAAKAGAGAFRE